MKVNFGQQELELGGPYIDAGLRESNDLLGNPEALRERMRDDGYLFIRGLQNRDNVLRARRRILRFMDEAGSIKPGTNLEDAIVNPDGPYPHTMGQPVITHTPEVRSVLESKEIFDFFREFHGRPVRTFDYKWLRAVRNPDATGTHIDVVYMGRGTQDHLFTCWTPFHDIPIEQGPLVLCVGSHKLPGYAKVRETYGKMDVDRDRVGGFFTKDPREMVDRFGGKWQTAEFRAGDVLIFGMFVMHGALRNESDRWRISCDTRFQPADLPIDERWIGENPIAHYSWSKDPQSLKPMEVARQEWGV